jgi:hypothetical protein
VFASGKDPKDSEIHAPFKLAASGSLLFAAPDGTPIQRVDYPKLKDDTSYAMDMNDFTKWEETKSPTPGAAN